jgi:hypothetical protein
MKQSLKSKLVPFLIAEKAGVFFESIACAQQALQILRNGKIKGVKGCERKIRRALGAYPIEVNNSALTSNEYTRLILADHLVLNAWHTLNPTNHRDIEQWEKVVENLCRACSYLVYVYRLELDLYVLPSVRNIRTKRPDAFTLTRIEMLRLRQRRYK